MGRCGLVWPRRADLKSFLRKELRVGSLRSPTLHPRTFPSVCESRLRHHFISKIILSGNFRETDIHYLLMEVLAPKFAHSIDFP